MDDFDLELKNGFLDEAGQLLADTEQCFLDLENQTDNPAILEKIFRLAHNLKGSAKAVGFGEMGEFTHQLESLLLKLKKGELSIQTSTVSLLLQCNDHLRNWVQALKENSAAQMSSETLLEEIRRQLSGETFAALPAEIPSAALFEVNDLPESLVSVSTLSASIEEGTEPVSISKLPVAELAAAKSTRPEKPAASPDPAPAGAPGSAPEENIRVNTRRLEKLMNNVGELVILQTVLNQQKFQVQSPLLQKTISQLSKITKDIQDISMSLRMIPLKPTFQKMQRIVRDTSKSLGKDIHLHLNGEDTELDKTVVDYLGDPLVHLIRNAVDHGVESGEEREAAKKPRAGNIYLSAFHRGGQIVIEIRDDGKGLDAERLRQKAIEKGIITPSQKLSETECHHLIFAAGFSTKTEVTDVSGRGVGMDVVKTNVEKMLHGEIVLTTELGRGTRFEIILPLTLAIIDGMIVLTGNERYIIPIPHVHESIRPKVEDVHYVTGLGEVLSLRGEEIPLFRLTGMLNRKATATDAASSIAIVVRMGDKPFAVLVDDILGQQQVVIKRLGAEIQSSNGITGGAILGDGKAALILDVVEMITNMGGRDRKTQTLRGIA